MADKDYSFGCHFGAFDVENPHNLKLKREKTQFLKIGFWPQFSLDWYKKFCMIGVLGSLCAGQSANLLGCGCIVFVLFCYIVR